jgi:hypothetical protein
VGGCHMAGKRQHSIDRAQAIRALTDGVEACAHCRPDSREPGELTVPSVPHSGLASGGSGGYGSQRATRCGRVLSACFPTLVVIPFCCLKCVTVSNWTVSAVS